MIGTSRAAVAVAIVALAAFYVVAYVGCVFSLGDVRADASDMRADASVPCGVPFSPTGPWCYRLPATAASDLASNSSDIVQNIKMDLASQGGVISLHTDTESTPIYTVDASTASNWGYHCPTMTQPMVPSALDPALLHVPTRSDMASSMGSDKEITIYDPGADQEWEFWVASNDAGHWSACWGGTIMGVSHNIGAFAEPTGATGTGLPLLGFVIRIAELQHGLIAHALNIELPRTQALNVSWPANRTSGTVADPNVIMAGQRVRLDPSFDVGKFPSAERTIAKAMQDYGMLVSDTATSVAMEAEDDRPYMAAHQTTSSPYDAIFEGRTAANVLSDIPIGSLQVFPKDYGEAFMQ